MRFFSILSALVLLSFCTFYFAQGLPTTQGFEDMALTPPQPPTSANGSIPVEVNMELRSYDTRELITDVHVLVELVPFGSKANISTLAYVGQQGQIHLRVDAGEYELALRADNAKTYGSDYFSQSKYQFYSNANKTVYLLSVGSLRGMVYSKGGMIVSGASVKADCGAVYSKPVEMITDSYGSYKFDDLRAGPCKLSAVMGNQTGNSDVEIRQGEIADSKITLEGTIEKEAKADENSFNYAYLLVGIAIIAAIAAEYYFGIYVPNNKKEKIAKQAAKPKTELRKKVVEEKKAPIEHHEVKQTHGIAMPKKAPDILKTLGENECKIINLLCESGGHSTQAKIKNTLFIPKTTLARLFKSLEKKNIVEIKKSGRLKRVELTKWFCSD